jgi:heterodisulfide reductase subunit B
VNSKKITEFEKNNKAIMAPLNEYLESLGRLVTHAITKAIMIHENGWVRNENILERIKNKLNN